MALNTTPGTSLGVYQATNNALDLFDPLNKASGFTEDTNPQPIDEYESTMDEKKIIELVTQWKRDYRVYADPIEKSQKLAFDYWVGKQRTPDGQVTAKGENQQVDNLIFEAVETFLPIATRANPEPVVNADPSELGQKLAKDISVALVHEADAQKLRRKLARATRQWVINRLGVLKVCWDVPTKSNKTEVINSRSMIFDRDGWVDDGGRFHGEYIGEKKKVTADRLIEMFPKKKDYITLKVQGKMGTKIDYYEWWYCGTDVFYTIDSELLGKYKNPHWNYDGEVTQPDPETGEPVTSQIRGSNHFKEPQAPYIFLSVFSTGLQPHDDTGLIIQNIPIQDRINTRYRQIGKNVDGMNNGMIVSGTAFNEDQAAGAASALRRGMAIRVPNGDVNQAVKFPERPALPRDVFESLRDDRNELRNIFGTSGSTPEGTEQQKTVRGKILVNQMDSSRIGGGVTECIEQVADAWFNWQVQLMFVYWDEEHFIVDSGAEGGAQLIALKNQDFPLLQTLTVTVKEGSLVPKDPLTQRNEAMDLWSAGATDPLTFFKRLDFPDPAQATQQLILWQMLQKGAITPEQYLPSFQLAPGPALPVQGVGGPAVNDINGPNVGEQAPPPQSPGAVQQQSANLLGAVPL